MLGNDFELILQHQPMVKSEKPIVGSIVEVWVCFFFSAQVRDAQGQWKTLRLEDPKKGCHHQDEAGEVGRLELRDQKAKLTVAKGHR